MPAHHRIAPLPARPGERAALVAILAVAALLRLWRLDLMEFKADEAQACQLALQVLGHLRGSAPAGQDFPLVGLLSSVGVPNPPLFIYLVALPLAFVRDPLAAAAFIALGNVAAVGLCYLIGRRYFSPFIALASAALYALAPWAVIFSRKIWAQDLLPFFLGGFLLAAHAFLVDRRPRALAWLLVLAAAAMQLHLSALILAGALAGLLVAGRSAVRARWLGLGAAAALALCAPYLLHLARTHGSDFAHLGAWRNESARLVPAGQRLIWALRFPLSISGADATDALVGTQAPWVFPFALVTGLAAAGGLIRLCWRDRRTPLFSSRLMLAVWLVLPTLGLAATGAVPIIHYFIVLYPVVFLGLAAAVEAGLPRWRVVSWTALAGCLAGYAWLDASLFRSVAERGGAPSDYGVAYAEKAGAIDFILGQTPAGFPVLFDGAHPDGGLPPEYRFLLEEKSRGRTATPAGRYLLIDSFRFQLTPAGVSGTRNLPRREFGPLTIFALPPP